VRKTLYACSGNPGKLREFTLAAREFISSGITVEPLPDLRKIPPPDESGISFEENSRLKAAYYSRFTNKLVFADDSGLEVDALGGGPGVYSARYAGPEATDADNNALLLKRLEGFSNRRARFVCVLAAAQRGRVLYSAEDTVEGEILTSPRGRHGFGYDPLFFYPPWQRSLAEIPPEEKSQVSHRGKAMRKLLKWFCNRYHQTPDAEWLSPG
jgi:XTP/dITP diphosphohydrolase